MGLINEISPKNNRYDTGQSTILSDSSTDLFLTTLDDNKFYSDEELTDSVFKTEKNLECYISCEICSEEGNYIKHNCLSCEKDYPYELKLDGTINCYNICDYYSYYNINNNKNYCTANFSCPNDFNKLIQIKNQCIDNCSKDEIYQYEFRKTCYQECPQIISKTSEIKDFYCEAICPQEYPFEIIETQECVDSCSIIQRAKSLCIINFLSENNENNQEVEEKSVENIKEELTNNFDTSDIYNGDNIIIEQKDSTVTISTTENQKNIKSTNLTSIDLGECEKKVKDEYHIPENEPLYILKIDVKQEGLKIPKIAYEVYYPLSGDNLIKLNLTVCKDSKIEISIPVALTDDIDKINPASEYYNDICYTYTSEDGTDISLLDRKINFVDKNLTVCEEDCYFNEYINGKAICSCNVKTNSSTKIRDNLIDTNKLFGVFTNFKNMFNIKVLKCYRLIFNLNEYKHNYGNLILLSIIIFFIVSFFIFYCKDYYNLEKILNIIIYFKLNSNLVEKFLKRVNKDQNPRIHKKEKVIIYNKGKENKGKKIEKFKYLAPISLMYFNLIRRKKISNVRIKNMNIFGKSEKKLGNPIKKNRNLKYNNKLFDNIPSSKKDLNKNNKTIKIKNIIINNYNFPYNMNENQMFKMFLNIHIKSDFELNQMDYESAIKIDKRTYFQYYLSLLKTKHLLIFSFWPIFDYNSKILKIFLFFFNFSLSFLVNALFINDETMHKIYEEKGAFDLLYNIPQILFSSLISDFINGIIQELALTQSDLINLKQKKDNRNIIVRRQDTIKTIKIKLILFFVITLLLLIFFFYYLACFCAVYKNTQIHLIKDTLISFGTSMITPFGICILPGLFRLCSFKTKQKCNVFIFKLSRLLQLLC